MPDRHALLGASSSHRWLCCPPSARLEELVPNKSTKFTEEGTKAHAICEQLLHAFLNGEKMAKPEDVDDEMWRCATGYRDFVEEKFNEALAKTKDSKLFIEQELDFAEYVPEGFGTSDAVIVSDDTLTVIDFKYGKGVAVDANDNPQLRLYALGAFLKLGPLYDFALVESAVYQPRLDSVSIEYISVADLVQWAEDYVKPRAELAFKGEGEFCVGEHCRFCRVGATCRARVVEAFEVIDKVDTRPELIEDDEIPAILDKLDNAEEWIKAIRAYALDSATKGTKWKGYKLVESRTKRKIINPIEALEKLEQAGYDREDITTLNLKGITELTKVLGSAKFKELLADYVVKPQGSPTLVHDTDERPEIDLIAEAFKEDI